MDTPATALTVVARAALALGSDKARAELAELVKKSANIVEVKNTAGREECHSAAMVLVRARTNIEKIGKAARDDATKFSKAVIAEEKALIDITQPEEARLLALRDGWDKARAAEKAEAERIERERVAAIHARIGQIKAFATLALECRTAAKVDELLVKLNDGAHCTPSFEEFEEEGVKALTDTRARMVEIRDAKLAEEQERARVAAEQEAERQRLAAERAELERQQAEARAAQAQADAKAKAERDAAEAQLAAERAAFAAEQERQREAQATEARRLAAVADELERQRVAALPKPEPKPAPEPVIQMIEPAPSRPTDIQIVEALAERFGVPEPVALSWLIDFDVETALDVYETATA